MTIRSHPLRAALSEEMHLRRLPRFGAPARLMQIVTLLGNAGTDEARAHIDTLAAGQKAIVPIADKFGVIGFDDMTLVWERHTEFATYTLIRSGEGSIDFSTAHFGSAIDRLIAEMPGEIVRATHVVLAAADTAGGPAEAELERLFAADSLIVCDVADGFARIASDFRLNQDGYGHLLVLDRGLARDEAALLVLRVQELGNYRKMALLGLPVAQSLSGTLSGLETRLAELTHAVSERASEDDKLLDELTFLSAELARLAAQTRYRMSATRAYAQLCAERLEALAITPVQGFQTLADFTERRLMPAVRTCDSFSARIEDLLQRAAWTSELLRTRIDISLAKQNRDLLTSMDRRTHLQLRLQQTVEGLSVVAISYYLVALVGYVLGAVPHLRKDIAIAITVPVVVLAVALALRGLRKRIHS